MYFSQYILFKIDRIKYLLHNWNFSCWIWCASLRVQYNRYNLKTFYQQKHLKKTYWYFMKLIHNDSKRFWISRSLGDNCVLLFPLIQKYFNSSPFDTLSEKLASTNEPFNCHIFQRSAKLKSFKFFLIRIRKILYSSAYQKIL